MFLETGVWMGGPGAMPRVSLWVIRIRRVTPVCSPSYPIHPEPTASSFHRGRLFCSFFPTSLGVIPGSDQGLVLKSERGGFPHC